MPRHSERLPLDHATPGARRDILVHRYGTPGARPKAYFQASLHADEVPAMLTAQHLLRRLDQADARGEIRGEIVVVPYANPLGLAQFVSSEHVGRYELGGGGNFNRNWPDLFAPIAETVGAHLGDSETENVAAIRAAMRAHLDGRVARNALDSLRLILAHLAFDADLVFDMHCDEAALIYMFLIPDHWPLAADIAAELGCRAVLLAADSGGASFDEAFSLPWTRLAAKYPDHPIPAACLATTLELRGQADVTDALAERDAGALLRGLQHHGVVVGEPGPLPEALCDATGFDACETLRAPTYGIVTYAVALGDHVRKGDLVARLTDPADDPATAPREVRAGTDGLVLSLRDRRWLQPGQTLARIAGREPLPERQAGTLLDD